MESCKSTDLFFFSNSPNSIDTRMLSHKLFAFSHQHLNVYVYTCIFQRLNTHVYIYVIERTSFDIGNME